MKNIDDLRPRTVRELIGDDSPLLTRCGADITPRRQKLPPMKWWLVDEFRNVLVTQADIDDYEIELDDIDDKELSLALEQVVGWIHNIGGKAWANPEMVGEMAIFLSRLVVCRVWARSR